MLNIHIPTIIFQIINFFILAAALYFLLFRKVMQSVQKRAKEKEDLLKEIEKNKAESENALKEYESKLKNINKEVDDIVATAKQDLEEERKLAVADLDVESNRILGEAQAEVEHRQHQAMEQFYEKVIDQVMATSQTVISKSIPPELHAIMVQQMADEMWRLGREDVERVSTIRASLRERTPTVHVDSAMPLGAEQNGLLVRTFSALADRNIKLVVKVDAALGAGVRVRIGDMVVDNSIAAQVAKLRDAAAVDLKKRLEL